MADRIMPQQVGGKIEDGIDEIVKTGVDVHIEMLRDNLAWMKIGDDVFFAKAERGRIVIRYGGSNAGR